MDGRRRIFWTNLQTSITTNVSVKEQVSHLDGPWIKFLGLNRLVHSGAL